MTRWSMPIDSEGGTVRQWRSCEHCCKAFYRSLLFLGVHNSGQAKIALKEVANGK